MCGEKSFVPDPVPPSSSWGWIKTDAGLYEPHWTTLQEASKTSYELICCGYKKGCRTNCKCKKVGLQCTALCKCEGDWLINQVTVSSLLVQKQF